MPTLLVVDDDIITARLVQAVVEAEVPGSQAWIATSCQTAWSQLSATQPDVMLVECWLPCGGSSALVNSVVSMYAEVQLILTTSNGQPALLSSCPDRYLGTLTKPFSPSALMRLLSDAPGFASALSGATSAPPGTRSVWQQRWVLMHQQLQPILSQLSALHTEVAQAGMSDSEVIGAVDRNAPVLLNSVYELCNSCRSQPTDDAQRTGGSHVSAELHEVRNRTASLLASLHAMIVELHADWWAHRRVPELCRDYLSRITAVTADLSELLAARCKEPEHA